MGNYTSISQNNFNDQLISSCLWSLKKKEIIKHYQEVNNNKLKIYNNLYSIAKNQNNKINQDINVETNHIPYLYKSSNKRYDSNEYKFIITCEEDNFVIISDMISEYLQYLLGNTEETNKVMMDIIHKLSINSNNNPLLIDNMIENNKTYLSDDKEYESDTDALITDV
jgi:hypothetical protein